MSPRSCSISWHTFSPWHNLSKLSSAHVPAKRCFLLFTLQKACYTRSVCCPREALFIVVNVVFVVFHPQQATRERARRREGVPIVWRISFSRRRGRVARGKPLGLRPPPVRRAVAGSAVFREAVRPADPPRGLIAQGAAALVFAATLTSAARGVRLEGGREGEVGGELHRARILRAAVAPLVEGEAGLGSGSDGLRAVPPPETLPWLSLAERTVSVRFLA